MQTDQFLNKKIALQNENKEKFEGICEKIGPNEFFPSWGIVIILNDRTPITNVDLNTIKITE